IANDAFELATLINDNTIMDTSETALMLFARADLLMYQKKDSLAMLTLDTIQAQFSDHSLMDDILYRKANVFKSKGDYIQAAEYFQKVVDYYSYDILADNSLYYLAELYELHLNDKEKAKELYNKLMLDFPGSIYVIEARKRFRLLRGDKIEKLENKTLYQ
ncbi:MAG: tetratricopeptide repeat protein, partial [Bacteroidota bacterium]